MQQLNIIKALADESRLHILNSLLEKAQYVEELAERMNLSPSTMSFHLKKLEDAGLVRKVKSQYYAIYHINEKLLDIKLKYLILTKSGEQLEQEERIKKYREKVLNVFMKNGAVLKMPAQYKKRRIILDKLAEKFKPGQVYTEAEINYIIKESFDDYCAIRRFFIDERIMQRKNGLYQLRPDYKKEKEIL
ncbi:MAG TPA: metalloregulator ArsR/SmtB family transcription factor [Ignavibacteriales bacterium]|nr:metalloregulator ArsR/SmtB family transcription factor [Ignavibacteriales bacterium]